MKFFKFKDTTINHKHLLTSKELTKSISRISHSKYYVLTFGNDKLHPTLSCHNKEKNIKIKTITNFSYFKENINHEDIELLEALWTDYIKFLFTIPTIDIGKYILNFNTDTINRTYDSALSLHFKICFINKGTNKYNNCILKVTQSYINHPSKAKITADNGNQNWTYEPLSRSFVSKTSSERLSIGELKMLEHSSIGHSIEETADEMCKSISTIKSYRKSVVTKWGAKNIIEAVTIARENNLL